MSKKKLVVIEKTYCKEIDMWSYEKEECVIREVKKSGIRFCAKCGGYDRDRSRVFVEVKK